MIDLGASHHLTSCQEYFLFKTSGKFGHLMVGNNGPSKIIRIGKMHLRTSIDCKLVLKHVRHMSDTRSNLIWSGVVNDEGFSSQF